jgi:hypothetical protein
MSHPRRHRRAAFTFALIPLILLITAVSAIALTAGASTRRAADWLARDEVRNSMNQYSGVQADAVDALYAARRRGRGVTQAQIDAYANDVERRALDYSNTAGATAKLIMTAVTSGRNPRCFGAAGEQLDLLGLLETYYDNDSGRYGTTGFDQALSMLAAAAAGRAVPRRARAFVRSHRGKNGWNYALDNGPGDDVDTTAMVLMAMRAAGEPRSAPAMKAGLSWLRLQRNSTGGFSPKGRNKPTQSNTTALAAQAARAMGSRDRRAIAALLKLQLADGAFGNTRQSPGALANKAVATVEALIAVSGSQRPVRTRSAPPRTSC